MKTKTNIVMLLVVIGAILLSSCMSQNDSRDEIALAGDKNIQKVRKNKLNTYLNCSF